MNRPNVQEYPADVPDSPIPYRWCPLRFGKDGQCLSPETRRRLLDEARSGDYTDVFVFSHGWNNDWDDAEALYAEFIARFHRQVAERGLGGRTYRPLWVGIHWPSAILVLPSERDVEIASAEVSGPGSEALLERLDEPRARRLKELGERPVLGGAETLELARLVINAIPAAADDELPGLTLPDDPARLVAAWREMAEASEDVGSGIAGVSGTSAGTGDQPEAAGEGLFEDGRTLFRAGTVWPMKDRSGVVGRVGVAPLISELDSAIRDRGAALRLLGHSFGSKVVLAALCSPEFAGRRATSALLLQAAISARCFSADAYGGQPGGYRRAFDRVSLPIVATYSALDRQLHDQYDLAVCRRYDIGEREPAPAGLPVPLFAALGGYGPQRVAGEVTWWTLERPYDAYPEPPARVPTRLIALDGTDKRINSHGDVKNDATAWAQFYLMGSGGDR